MHKLLTMLVGIFARKRRVDPYREKKIERSRKEFRADTENTRKGYWQDKSNILYFNHRR